MPTVEWMNIDCGVVTPWYTVQQWEWINYKHTQEEWISQNYTEWKKPDTKVCILYDFTRLKKKKQNQES